MGPVLQQIWQIGRDGIYSCVRFEGGMDVDSKTSSSFQNLELYWSAMPMNNAAFSPMADELEHFEHAQSDLWANKASTISCRCLQMFSSGLWACGASHHKTNHMKFQYVFMSNNFAP